MVNKKTIIVLSNVPKSEDIFFNPILTNKATRLANIADAIAYISQAFDFVFCAKDEY